MYPGADKTGIDMLIKANISRVYDEMKMEARGKEG
jgi:hypothetical protein